MVSRTELRFLARRSSAVDALPARAARCSRRRVPRSPAAIAASGTATPNSCSSVALQARQVPLLVDRVRRHEARDDVGDHVAADAVDVLLHALGFEQLVALVVDHLALVVVDVVEVEQVLADVEVVRLDLALRVVDLLGHQRAFDDVVFLQAHARHHALHPVGGEDAHQVVFERQVEARRARVALAAGAAAQLVVDAARSRGARCRRCAGRPAAFTSSWRFCQSDLSWPW